MRYNVIKALKEAAGLVAKRFPLCLCYIAATSVYLLNRVYSGDQNGVVLYMVTAGTLMNLMLSLWGEELENKKTVWGVTIVANILLLADAIWLNSLNDRDFNSATYIARMAVYAGFTLGCVYLPFWKNKDDLESSNFGSELARCAGVGIGIGSIMAIGLCALFIGTLNLFSIQMGYLLKEKITWSIVIVCLQLLAELIALSLIPHGQSKHESQFELSRFYRNVLRYLFIPLVICYLVVLYAYMATIIAKWELPQGTLTWMVSAMMSGLIAVIAMLYPVTLKGGNSYEKFAARYLPLLTLPLIILMTTGVARRIYDYGITANRLYDMTLNVWFYIVCIGLYVTRSRRIHWVMLSFGALFLLTSAQPFNYSEIVRRVVRNKIESAIADCRPDTAFSSMGRMEEWLKEMPDQTKARKVYDWMSYLNENGYRGDLNGIIDRNTYFTRTYNLFDKKNDETEELTLDDVFPDWKADTLLHYSSTEHYHVRIAPGLENVAHIDYKRKYYKKDLLITDGKITINGLPCSKKTFVIDGAAIEDNYYLYSTDNTEVLHIQSVSVKEYRNLALVSITGYLFFN